jgi:Copper/zinc superoxide dismutase (SODC)
VSEAIVEGKTYVIDFDLRSYFDTVRHRIVLKKVASRVRDDKVLRLLKLILKGSGKQGRLASTSIQAANSMANLTILDTLWLQRKAVFTWNIVAKNVTMQSGTNSLFKAGGTSLVLHAQENDNRTGPNGNSGDRIACGLVTITAIGT